MKLIDARMCELVALIAIKGGRVDGHDPALEEYSGDRTNELGVSCTDTFNLCFDGGLLSQVQVDDDAFLIELGP